MTGYTRLATTTLAGNLIPDMTGSTASVSVRVLGSRDAQFQDIYTSEMHVGPNSLYVNGRKVISDNSNTITFSTDINQNVDVKTTGSGNLKLISETGNLYVQSSSTVKVDGVSGVDITVPSNGGSPYSLNLVNNSSGDISILTGVDYSDIVLTANGAHSMIRQVAGNTISLTAPIIELMGNVSLGGNLSLGTISSGTWNGNTIAVAYGGTGTTTLTGMLKGNATGAFTGITGTTNYLTKWSDANTISASSILYEDGSVLGIGGRSTITAIGDFGTLGSISASGTLRVFGTSTLASTTIAGNFSVNTDQLYVSSTSGYIGVGTNSPEYKLDILGVNNYPIRIKGSAGGGLIFGEYDATGGSIWSSSVTPSQSNYALVSRATNTYLNAPNGSINFMIANSTKMLMSIAGNLGIGTSAPSSTLHLVNTSGSQFTLGYSGTKYTTFGTDASGDLRVTPNGGTTTLSSNLFVTGTSNLQNLQVTNSTTTGNQVVLGNLNVSGTSTLATTSITELSLLGSLKDSTDSVGSSDMILRSTGTSTQWVSTSTIVGGNALVNLNGLTASTQTFATGTGGSIFNIVSSGFTHTFNMPIASAVNTGQLQNSDWLIFNNKLSGSGTAGYLVRYDTATTTINSSIYETGNSLSLGNFATITTTNGNLTTLGNLSASGTLAVSGNATIYSDLRVVGTSTLGNVQIAGNNIGLSANADLLQLSSGGLTIDGVATSTQIYVSGNAVVEGTLTVSDGSSTNPSIAFVGDPNTGFYRYEDDTISITAGSSEAMRISDMQISMFNPVSFEAVGDVAVANNLIFTNSTASYIKSDSSLYVQTNSSYLDLDLVLSAANLGDVVVDDTFVVTGTSTLADTSIATLAISGDATTTGNQVVSGNLTVGGTINGSFISSSSTFTNFTFGSATGTNLVVLGNTSLATTTVAGTFDATGIISALGGNSTQWNTTYNTVTASSSYWDSAYGWGNHASAGYLLSSTASTTYLSLSTWFSTTTLPSNIVNSSLTGVGVLNSGSINTGFGTILTNNTITGTTLNGTTGINTGADSGTQRIDASGNLVNIGTITSGLINGQTISSFANFTGTLAVVGTSTLATTTISSLAVTDALNVSGLSTLANLQVAHATTTGNLAVLGFTNLATTTITGDLTVTGIINGSASFSSSTILNLAFTNATGTNSLVMTGNTTLASTSIAGNFAVNTNQLYVNPVNGNVGIGTDSPNDKLQVNGSIRILGSLKDYSGFGILGYDTYSPGAYALGNDEGLDRDFIFWGDIGEIITFKSSSGNVGIGTTTPQYALDIYASDQYLGQLRANGGIFGDRDTYNNIKIGYDNIGGEVGMLYGANDELIVGVNTAQTAYKFAGYDDDAGVSVNISSGYVGIGTTTPESTFTVNGTTLLYGNVTTTGSHYIGSALNVSGLSTLASLEVTNATTTGNLAVLGLTNLATTTISSLTVSGNATTSGNQVVSGNLSVGGTSTLATTTISRLVFDNGKYLESNSTYGISSNGWLSGTGISSSAGIYGTLVSRFDSPSTNIGMYLASNNFNFKYNNNSLLYVHASGTIGIGTTTPSSTLHVASTSAQQFTLAYDGSKYTTFGTDSSGDLRVTPNGGTSTLASNLFVTGTSNLQNLQITNATTTGNLGVQGNLNVTGTSTLASTTVAGAFAVNTNQLYVNPSNGYVGIGTSTPSSALHVINSTLPQFTLGYDSLNYTTFETDGSGNLTISPTGNIVGIMSEGTDGLYIGDYWDDGDNTVGLYSGNGDQILAEMNLTDNTYTYGNGALLVDGVNSNSLFSNNLSVGGFATITQSGNGLFTNEVMVSGTQGNLALSSGAINDEIGIINKDNDSYIAVYDSGDDAYYYGNTGLKISSSGSSLFSGDLSVGGVATITALTGDISTVGNLSVGGTATFTGNILPSVDNTYTLGSDTNRWKDLYLGPNSINIGTAGNYALLGYDTTNDYLSFNPSGNGVAQFVMTDGGYFGIGTTTPQQALVVNGNMQFDGDGMIMADTVVNFNTSISVGGTVTSSNGFAVGNTTVVDSLGNISGDRVDEVVEGRSTYSTLNDRFNAITANYSSIMSNASLFSDDFRTATSVNTSNTTAAYNTQIGTIQNDLSPISKIDINYGYGDSMRALSGNIIYGNKLYMATYGYGVKVLDLDTESIANQWNTTSVPALTINNFSSIAYDYDRNDIYVGMYSGAPGLVKIDVDANTITTYTTAHGLKSNSIGSGVGNVMYYYNNKVYLFPSGNYMQVFNVASGTFTDYGSASGLPQTNYTDVIANGNELYISNISGFYIWNMDTDTLTKRYYANGPQGLYNYTNTIYASWQDPDDSDIVWLSGANSWQKLSKANGWQEFHRTDEELGISTASRYTSIRKIGNQIWLGSYAGMSPSGYLVYDLNVDDYFVISSDFKVTGEGVSSGYNLTPLYYNGYYYFSFYSLADVYKSQLIFDTSSIFETNVIINSANDITSAKLIDNSVVGTGNAIDWYLSADNGVNWEGPVTPNVLWEFTNIGKQVKAKAVMTAGVGTTPIIKGITVTAFDGDTWAGEGSNTVETEVIQARSSATYGIFASLDLRLEDIDTKIGLAVTSTHTHDDRYLQVSGGTVSGSVVVSGNVTSNHMYTNADSTYNLGSSSAYWLNTYSDNVYFNSTAYLSGTTAGTITVNGKLGVGTTTPSAFLQIYNATSTPTVAMFAISTSTSGGGANIFKVTADGNVTADGSFTSPAADYAEYFYTNNTDLVSGEAVCIDVTRNNSVARCTRLSDTNIIGIVSTKPAMLGNGKEEYENNPNYKMIALLGQIPAYVINENGNINPGDSLTSASRSGYLMKANPGDSTVGIALESLSSDSGSINVLISRRNKSLTVEQIENQITDRIANMEMEDEVAIMISGAISNYNFASTTESIINNSLDIVYDSLDQTSDTVAILADEINRLKGSDYKTNVWDFIRNADSIGNLYQVNLQSVDSYGFGDFNDIYVTGENATGYSIYNKLSTALDGKAQTAFGNYTELQTSDSVDVNYGSYIVSASDSKAGTQIGQYINLNSASTTNWAIFVDNLGGKSYFGDNVLVGAEVPVLSWTEFNMTGDDLFVKGDIGVGGDMFVDGTLSVKGNAEFLGDLLVIGDIYSSGSFKSSNSGYAQMMELADSNFEYGDVVVLGDSNSVKLSDRANSSNILGIIAEKPAFISGNSETGKPIVTMGASLVNVTASNGLIKKGDYLTTSNEIGKAQKASKLGAGVIGIAMEDMEGGHDQIAISVQIGYFNNHGITIEVAKSGGDFENILSAMSSITDSSESKRYVINIKAGEYSETITLKPYVDVVCENSSNTIIIGSSAPAVIGANNSRIENCSLKSTGSVSNVSVVSILGSSPVINNNRIISEVSGATGINIENTTASNINPVISENEFIGSMNQGIVNFASDNDMIVMNNNIQNVSGQAIATLNGIITSSGNIFKGLLVDINIGENGKLLSTNDKFETFENLGTFIDFTGNGNKLAHYVIDGFMLESTSTQNSLVATLSSGEAYINGVYVSTKPARQVMLLPNVENYIYIDSNGEILVTSIRSDENKVLLSVAKTNESSILAISNDRQNEVVVAKQGGDYTSISEALSKIKLNSANNRWLITVKPGIYNEQVILKPYVDIVGSGRENTRITQINHSALIASSKSSVSNMTIANYGDEIGQEVITITASSTDSDKFSFDLTNVLIDYNKSDFAMATASSSAIKIVSGFDNENLATGSTSSASLVDLKFNSIETKNVDIAINWSLYDENWSATSSARMLSHIDISASRLSSNYSDIKTTALTGDILNSSEYVDTTNAVSLITSSYNLYSGNNLSFDLGNGTKLTTSHDNYGKVVGSNALVLNDFNRNVAQYDDLWVLQNGGQRIMSVNGNGNILMSPQNVALDSFSMSQNISSTTLTVVATDDNVSANFFGRVVISPSLNASGTPSGIAELMFSSDGVISANGNKLQVGKTGDTVDLNVEGVAYILPDSAVRDTITAYVDVPRVDTRVWGNGENSWRPAEDIKILKLKAQYKCGDGGSISLRLEDKNNSELATISGGNCSNGYANIESDNLNINLTSEDGMHVTVTQVSSGGEESEDPSQLTITVEYVYRRDLASGNSNKNNN